MRAWGPPAGSTADRGGQIAEAAFPRPGPSGSCPPAALPSPTCRVVGAAVRGPRPGPPGLLHVSAPMLCSDRLPSSCPSWSPVSVAGRVLEWKSQAAGREQKAGVGSGLTSSSCLSPRFPAAAAAVGGCSSPPRLSPRVPTPSLTAQTEQRGLHPLCVGGGAL